MTNPASSVRPVSTRLDPRYSDPTAIATTWEETERALARAQIFRLTTVRADGRPHMTPVVAAWGDAAVHFHTGETEQKYLNLQANPNVILSTGGDDWDRGIEVIVEGRAVHVTDQAVLAGLVGLWAEKWDGRWKLTAGADGKLHDADNDGGSRLFTVVPTKIFAHAKGDPFGATTHRF
jgi:general stress protein 26